MRLIPYLLAFQALAIPAYAADSSDCAALRVEVETLRAKVHALEAAAQTINVIAPTRAADATLPGTAAKPAATQTLVIEEPYSRTGCSRGLFKGIEPARWQDPELWFELEKGMSPAAVEALLGVEHYDQQGGGDVVWHYGRCAASSRAQALFSKGKLADWRPPSR